MSRKKIIGIIAGLVLTLAGLATVVQDSPAYAQGSNFAICYKGHCQNKWNNGATIRFYGYNNGGIANNGWAFHNAGSVSNGGANGVWPFTNGSGLNNRYVGDPVLQIGFQAAGGDFANGCMTSDGYNPSTQTGQLETTGCIQNSNGHLIPDQQLFVESSLGFLVPVYASNINYTYYHTYNLPVLEGCSGGDLSDGAPVVMTVGAGQLGPWTLNNPNVP